MWGSLKTRAMDFTAGGRFRRRGAKLGILIAIMVTLPGLVAATAYVTGANSGSLTTGTAASAAVSCGFWENGTGFDSGYFSSVPSGITTFSGTNAPLGGSLTATLTQLEVGSSGYQYMMNEFVFGCVSTPASPYSTSITITLSSSSGITGASWVVMEVNTTSALTSTTGWPNAGVNPTTGTACETTPANLYVPYKGTSVASERTWDAAETTAGILAPCSAASATGTFTLSPAAGIATDTAFLSISFAIVGATGALSASPAFDVSWSASVT